mmetsp:Transcript_133402/g.386132  ORF Transcript_133402/g.386132 Transcript_133402/m.386132 type:complete len:264 (+) Transcript_133402:2941-3732(+)
MANLRSIPNTQVTGAIPAASPWPCRRSRRWRRRCCRLRRLLEQPRSNRWMRRSTSRRCQRSGCTLCPRSCGCQATGAATSQGAWCQETLSTCGATERRSSRGTAAPPRTSASSESSSSVAMATRSSPSSPATARCSGRGKATGLRCGSGCARRLRTAWTMRSSGRWCPMTFPWTPQGRWCGRPAVIVRRFWLTSNARPRPCRPASSWRGRRTSTTSGPAQRWRCCRGSGRSLRATSRWDPSQWASRGGASSTERPLLTWTSSS